MHYCTYSSFCIILSMFSCCCRRRFSPLPRWCAAVRPPSIHFLTLKSPILFLAAFLFSPQQHSSFSLKNLSLCTIPIRPLRLHFAYQPIKIPIPFLRLSRPAQLLCSFSVASLYIKFLLTFYSPFLNRSGENLIVKELLHREGEAEREQTGGYNQ